MMIIDGHRHVGYCRENGTRTSEEIIAEMDRLGVARAVIAPSGMDNEGEVSLEEGAARQKALMAEVGAYLETRRVTPAVEGLRRKRIDHGDVLKVMRRHGDRLAGTWFANPWGGDRALADAAEAVRTAGFRCFKLHPLVHAYGAEETVVDPVLALAGELGVPAWFHTSYGPGTEIERVVESARRFPGTQVVLGHAGVGDLEGTLHAVAAARATRENENVWIDLSDCRLPAMRTMIEGGVPERLVLSSDDPFGSLERQLAQARQIAGADKELLAKVLGGNAARLYGL